MRNKSKIQKDIAQLELQIKKICSSPVETELFSELCNSLILKKAILKKELEDIDKNVFVEKVKKIFSKREKLICDYFN